jgi:hypothetical protein
MRPSSVGSSPATISAASQDLKIRFLVTPHLGCNSLDMRGSYFTQQPFSWTRKVWASHWVSWSHKTLNLPTLATQAKISGVISLDLNHTHPTGFLKKVLEQFV